MFNVFVGYDTAQDQAYQVCKHSILQHQPDAVVTPLIQSELTMYNRPADPLASTEFTYTRYLVPHLMNYEGWAVFCDCDFLWRADIKELFDLADPKYAIQLVKHNYWPTTTTKMNGKPQHQTPRKAWTSMMLINCSHIRVRKRLTPEFVNTATPQELHQLLWLDNGEIGDLSKDWNWLVGHYTKGTPKALHWTEGGPWLPGYENVEFADEWRLAATACSA